MPGPATYDHDYDDLMTVERGPSEINPEPITTEDTPDVPELVDGDRFAKSPTTNTYYRVSEWEDLGDGYIRATQKQPVPREAVPEEWLEVLDQ